LNEESWNGNKLFHCLLIFVQSFVILYFQLENKSVNKWKLSIHAHDVNGVVTSTIVEGLVLYSDCFVLNLVDQHIASSLSVKQMDLHKSHDSIGIGIKPNDILEWLMSQEEEHH
jgi:hypothetical protein